MSRVLRAVPFILDEQSNILTNTEKPMNSKVVPQTETPHSTQKSEPPKEKGGPLTCSSYKQSGGLSRPSPSGPAFSLQREYLSVVTGGWGPLGGSWSGLLWLRYTSRGKNLKIQFLTSSPQRASWCLESSLTHHHGQTSYVSNYFCCCIRPEGLLYDA